MSLSRLIAYDLFFFKQTPGGPSDDPPQDPQDLQDPPQGPDDEDMPDADTDELA